MNPAFFGRAGGGFRLALLALLSAPLLAAPSFAETAKDDLDDVLKRYEAARGGVAAWREIETLSASGIYASFSHRKPFKLEMRRPGYFHFDTESLNGATLWARDEQGPYWIFPAYGLPPWPVRVTPPSVAQMDRLALLEPPLMDARAKGHQVKLLGRGDLDGTPTIDLELTLATGEKEIWHLDPETYLELAIDATIFDFTQAGGPVPERSYPEDFRKVGKVLIPFKVEKEYLSRYSKLEITELKVNQGWPAEKFRMPINAGMEALRALTGDFTVKLEVPGRPNQPWRSFEGKSKVAAHFEGAVLDETFEAEIDGNKQQVLRRWAWDRFDELYRVMQTDLDTTHPHLFVGKLDGGKIHLDDSATGSAATQNGQETFERFRVEVKGPDELYFEGEQSGDGGKTWTPAWRMTYIRAKS